MARSRVLDAQLLFDLALFRFADQLPDGPSKWKAAGRRTILTTEGAVDYLVAKTRDHQVVTTHLVLAEVGRLARRILWPEDAAGDRSRTWPFLEVLRDVMADLKLDVPPLPSKSKANLLNEFGPTDADLIAVTLALSKAPGGAALLTADEPLAHWCESNRVPCEYFDRVVAALQ